MSEIAAAEEIRVQIETDRSIVEARQRGRAMAAGMGFSSGAATLIATAISELARNILQYAGHGEVVVQPIGQNGEPGMLVIARDQGPGIADLDQALEDGYSTSGRLGLGLPGVRRLMDEFELVSQLGEGTSVRIVKWKRA
jgi:serine/threonine-protein kinase RsbT